MTYYQTGNHEPFIKIVNEKVHLCLDNLDCAVDPGQAVVANHLNEVVDIIVKLSRGDTAGTIPAAQKLVAEIVARKMT